MPKPTNRASIKDRVIVGGHGLRGPDKQQSGLRPVDPSFGDPTHGDPPEVQRSPHQDAQHAAEVRGNPPMVQGADGFPEGLARPRKGPYDKDRGRDEPAEHVPGNFKRGR
jgi:hypothetical protein